MIKKDNTKATGKVNIVISDVNGKVKQDFTVSNLVVDTGLDYIASRMKDTTDTAMSHMAVGTDTTAAAGSDSTSNPASAYVGSAMKSASIHHQHSSESRVCELFVRTLHGWCNTAVSTAERSPWTMVRSRLLVFVATYIAA